MEIGEADSLTFLRVPQLLLEPLTRPFVQGEHRLAVVMALLVLFGHSALFHGDVVSGTDLLHGLGERAVLHLHHETDSVATLAAAETFVYASWRVDVEGRRTLLVERTKSYQVSPTATKCDVIAHHLFDAHSVLGALYGFLRDHL